MPVISLTRSASSSGTSGWYAIDDSDRVNFQYNADATLGSAGIEITQIVIHGRVRNSASAAKSLQLGFKPALNSGRNVWSTYNSANVLDGSFTAIAASNGSTWKYATFTRTYSGTVNADVFTRMAGHIRELFSAGNPIFLGIIQPRSQFETQIDLVAGYWKIDVTYELLGNIPSANVTTATLGSTVITTTVNKIISSSTTVLYYKIGSETVATAEIGTGVSHTYTPPTSLGEYFPNAQVATLRIEAETSVDGVSYGTVSTSVILTLPSDAAPTCTCTPTRTWVSGVPSTGQIAAYVQNKSGISLELSGTAKYGGSVDSYRATIENKTYSRTSAGSVAHSPFSTSGTVTYSYTVTDSRGLSSTYTGSVSVLQYSTPIIAGFSVTRVTSDGTVSYGGTYARASIQCSVSSLTVSGSQKNSIKYKIRYRAKGTTSWTDSDTMTVTGTSVNRTWQITKSGAAVGAFDDMTGYDFQLVVADIYGDLSTLNSCSVSAAEMPTKETIWDIREANGSMGFGGEATGTGATPEYDFYGLIRARNGVEGATIYSDSEVSTGNKWVDGKMIYSRTLTITKTSTSDLYYDFDFTGMSTVWLDAGTSFFVFSDGTVAHLGYATGGGVSRFRSLVFPQNNEIGIGSNGAGTAYIRLLYTKS